MLLCTSKLPALLSIAGQRKVRNNPVSKLMSRTLSTWVLGVVMCTLTADYVGADQAKLVSSYWLMEVGISQKQDLQPVI